VNSFKNIHISFVFLFLFFLSGRGLALAQELNCRVQVNSDQIGGTDKAVYESLRNAVTAFMNERQWSNAPIAQNEKIDCNLLFIIQSSENNVHKSELQIQSRRPVFGSSYTTSLLNIRQSLEFEYLENQQLEFNETNLQSNLTATLAFWTYIVLCMDFDSFAPYGGERFLTKASDIVSQAQGFLGDNWKANEDDKNCWGWTNALNDENQKPMRLLNYNYHRQGMDLLHQDAAAARKKITDSFKVLEEVKRLNPSSPLLSNLADSKIEEWIQLYSKAESKEKQEVFDLLSFIYPGQSNRLQAIKNQN
jgi:hypothetical protein